MYDELTKEQQAGIQYNAAHNKLPFAAYLKRLLENDGDRGYREMTALITAGIPLPEVVVEEPVEAVEVAEVEA
jgi:hypothetical protein